MESVTAILANNLLSQAFQTWLHYGVWCEESASVANVVKELLNCVWIKRHPEEMPSNEEVELDRELEDESDELRSEMIERFSTKIT